MIYIISVRTEMRVRCVRLGISGKDIDMAAWPQVGRKLIEPDLWSEWSRKKDITRSAMVIHWSNLICSSELIVRSAIWKKTQTVDIVRSPAIVTVSKRPHSDGHWLNIYSLFYMYLFVNHYIQDAQLSQRDRAAGCVIVFAKSRRLQLGDNILRTL